MVLDIFFSCVNDNILSEYDENWKYESDGSMMKTGGCLMCPYVETKTE